MSWMTFARNSYPNRMRRLWMGFRDWEKRAYAAPSPPKVKQAVLLRNGFPHATWVETGTYKGDTTKVLLEHSLFVYSIEPSPTLYENVAFYFNSNPNVEIINGTSEEVLPSLLPKLSGKINFWLDGHYSGGETFAGPNECPLIEELFSISQNIKRFDAVAILIDDVRLCGSLHSYGTYPPLEKIIDFAKINDLDWHIEHDIFVARSKPNQRSDYTVAKS